MEARGSFREKVSEFCEKPSAVFIFHSREHHRIFSLFLFFCMQSSRLPFSPSPGPPHRTAPPRRRYRSCRRRRYLSLPCFEFIISSVFVYFNERKRRLNRRFSFSGYPRSAFAQRSRMAQDLRELLPLPQQEHPQQHGGEAESTAEHDVHMVGDIVLRSVVGKVRFYF